MVIPPKKSKSSKRTASSTPAVAADPPAPAPHWLFDPGLYGRAHPELTAAALAEGGWADLFDHALRTDTAPSPLFDPGWYRVHYPAAAAEIAAGQWHGALHHYLANPTPADFDPLPDFSEAFYLRANPEVAAQVAAGALRCGYAHFLQHGMAAGLAPGPWLDPAAGIPAAADDNLDGIRARSGIAFAPGATPPLSIVAVIPRRPARALRTLASLQGGAPPGSELFALVSAEDRAAAEAMLPGARMLLSDDGILAARNVALNQASGALVLLIDATAHLPVDSLGAALRRMQDSAIGAVCGPLLDPQGRLFGAGGVVTQDGARLGYLRGATLDEPEAGFTRDVDYGSSALLLFRREVLAVGGFDESMDTDLADADFCLRLWQSGYRVTYDPRVALVHADPRGLRASSRHDLSAPGVPAAPAGQAALLLARHPAYVQRRLPADSQVRHALRSPRQSTDSVLVLADSFQAADTHRAELVPQLVLSGADVTVFPLDGGPGHPGFLPRNLPDSVEVVTGLGEPELAAFLAGRRGCFSRVEYLSDSVAARFRAWIEI